MNLSSEQALEYVTATVATAVMQKMTGSIELQEGVEMCMPGDNATFVVELIQPIAMEEQLRFAIREGGKTVGAGVVSKILE